jgi:hypothetical protein
MWKPHPNPPPKGGLKTINTYYMKNSTLIYTTKNPLFGRGKGEAI